MDSFQESAAFWVSLAGTFFGLIGALQTLTWLALIGGLMVVGSISAITYARRQRQRVESAVLKVAGRSLDSLNMATLRRRLNRSLVIQQGYTVATIDGETLTLNWTCLGYCRGNRETNIEFSIDSDNNIPFEDLRCFAYDLSNDPQKRHRIRPVLVGTDGISKKIAVPFLSPIEAGQAFHVLLICELPGCIKGGVDYYTATMSFDQEQDVNFKARLIFLHDRPRWLRVYELQPPGEPRLLKDLRPTRENNKLTEYLDVDQNMATSTARIYVFSRTPPLQQNSTKALDAREAA